MDDDDEVAPSNQHAIKKIRKASGSESRKIDSNDFGTRLKIKGRVLGRYNAFLPRICLQLIEKFACMTS